MSDNDTNNNGGGGGGGGGSGGNPVDTSILRKAFNRFLRRNNRLVPNQYQLLTAVNQWLQSKGLSNTSIDLSSVKKFLDAKRAVARFERPRRIRPKHFQTMPIIKLGVYHIDHSSFLPAWAPYNNNCTGFIVCVENFTNRLFVYPCQSTDTNSWASALKAFMAVTHHVNTLCSDYDGVPSADAWREWVLKQYGIRWQFLRRLPKAFLAERFVGYVKEKLSISLAVASYRSRTVVKRWIDFVEPLWRNYNAQIIPNTQFQRNQVTPDNFETFLSQLKRDPQPEMTFHFARAGPFAHKDWNRRLFRFDLGEKVFIISKSNPSINSDQLRFLKPSVQGVYDVSRIYTVAGRQLRATKNGDLIPVYSLKEFNKRHREDNHISRHFYFYENQLKSASLHKS